VALEYLLVHRGMRGQSFVYELLFDGPDQAQAPHLSGLIDVPTMASSRGPEAQVAGSTRGDGGPNAGVSRVPESSAKAINPALLDDPLHNPSERRFHRSNGRDASYVHAADRP